MANWKDIKSWKNKKYSDLTMHLQYDADSKTFTSVKVRVILTIPSGWSASSYASDAWCLLWGTPSNNTVYNIKAPKTNWGSASPSEITVTKAHTASTFSIPQFWVCCCGYMLPRGGKLRYSGSNGKTIEDTVYNWFRSGGLGRANYKHEIAAGQSVTGSSWEDNTAGSAPTISNPGNNSFSITGDSGDAGDGNSITETTLLWKITGDNDWRPCPSNTNTLGSTTLSSLNVGSSTASIRVYAKTQYKCKYPANTYIYSSESNAVINNYQPPSLPDTPSITSAKNEGKTKPRFTIKEDWTASWPESSPVNASSGVTGYEVVLRKNNSNIYLGDATNTDRTWTIDPIELTLAPKDTIQIGVKPYTTNGAGTKVYNANYKYGPDPAITVQNAAVVRVKVGTGKNTWVEGQVWIKGSDNKWHEADVVKIKTDDGWKESE